MSHIMRFSHIPRFLSPIILVASLLMSTLGYPTPVRAAPQIGERYKIIISEAGVYRITYAALTAAGFNPSGIDTDTFQLFNDDEEVALFMFDGGDHRFDAGDYFLFYGEAKLTRYTTTNVYWFVAGVNVRLLTTPVNGSPAGAPLAPGFESRLHFEEDLIYQSGVPMTGDDEDRWYWKYFLGCLTTSRTCRDVEGYKNTRNFTVDLIDLSTQPYSATLTVTVRGNSNEYQNPDHQIQVSVNGTQVSDDTFDGQIEYTDVISVSSSLLNNGANTITMVFPYLGTDIKNEGYINWFDIAYFRDFQAVNDELRFDYDQPGAHLFAIGQFTQTAVIGLDITAPKQPRWIDGIVVSGTGPYTATFEATVPLAAQAVDAAGASFIVLSPLAYRTPDSITFDPPANLRAINQGADYLIISHADFLTQAQQLADYRTQANGFRTKVIDVQDIYDEFNNGLMDPVAIRDFISYASHYWQPPRPRYVVLMGDGNYDFHHNLSSEAIYVPPWLGAVDPFQGETAADNRYVDIFGDEEYDSDGNNAHVSEDIVIQDQHMELTVDFGYHLATSNALQAQSPAVTQPDTPTLVKAIGDQVFWDEDLDGIWDSNERGVPGVVINLLENDVVTRTVVTDEQGKYFFEDIPSGVYVVEVVPPTGWQLTVQDAGDDERYDSDFDPVLGRTVPITYTYPESAQDDWDAGLIYPGTIGNLVWEDLDADGYQDAGEPGIPGVVMNLLQSGSVISTTVTDSNGFYFFTGLSDGIYEVQVDASNFSGVLAGYVISPQDQGYDTMPDLHLGRFPVNNVSEASEMVNRIIAYETSSSPGEWQKRVIFVADNTDPAGNFYEHSNAVADYIWPYPESSQKIYYLDNYTNSSDVKAAIINGIDQGAIFVTYNGHSSKRTWGDGFFDRVDIDSLNNTIFPVFLPMTCLEGQYINPGFASLGEQAVRTIGKGAIASWSPTGLGVATGHQFLYNTFFTGVTSGETMLGPLTTLAKQSLFESHSTFRDLLDTYVLLGDPALAVQMPDADVGIVKTTTASQPLLAGEPLTFTLQYSNTGVLTATNVLITDTWPSDLLNPTVTADPPLTQLPGPNFSWSVGDLVPGATGIITVTATVNPAISSPRNIDNTALISTSAADYSPANNQSTSTVSVLSIPVTLGGVTWYDVNGNTVKDTQETVPVPGVPISATNTSTLQNYTTVSDAVGHWQLNDLPAGSYEVTAAIPVGLTMTTMPPLTTTLLPGETDTNLNFGYVSPTAVDLASFSATRNPEGVLIQWLTSDESNTLGFYLWRSSSSEQPNKRITALLPAHNQGLGQHYNYLDRLVDDSTWYYWLEAVDVTGTSEFFGPVSVPAPSEGAAQALYLGFILR